MPTAAEKKAAKAAAEAEKKAAKAAAKKKVASSSMSEDELSKIRAAHYHREVNSKEGQEDRQAAYAAHQKQLREGI
jgi:hypothetical protein